MAELNMDAERAAFEAWGELTDFQKRGAQHEVIGWYYFDELTEDRWQAWQASAKISRRTAPVSSPIGEDIADISLPALTDGQIEALWAQHADTAKPGERRIAFGHAVEQKAIAPYAARIRQLERELAERKQSVDTPEFRELLAACYEAVEKTYMTEVLDHYEDNLIAYIDGRTAGAAPEGWHIERGDDVIRVSNRNEGFATLRKDGDDPRETVLYRYFTQLAAAPTPMNSGMEEGK